MPNFQGNKSIVLQPRDENISIAFSFPVKTSAVDTNNFLPFGTTIASGTVVGLDADDAVVTSDLIYSTPTVSAEQVVVPLQYTTSNGVGEYKLRFVLYLDNNSTMESDFNRVVCRDL